MLTRRLFHLGLAMFLGFAATAHGQKKKKEDITQTLPELKDPPSAVRAETGRLVFSVTPLSPKGLLSQQVRDALKELLQSTKGSSIVKLRAFVAGSGDLRRVQTLVSEVFTERKLALPSLTTVLVGALPMEGTQVVIESIAVDKKVMNPQGLAFLSTPASKDIRQAVAQLQRAVTTAGVKPSAVLRATCFLDSLDDVQAARSAVASAFPAAVSNFVQPQRLGLEPLVECEAVARLDAAPASAVVFVNPKIVLVNSPRVVLSGLQMTFRDQDSDLRLGFERLRKALEAVGASGKDVFWSNVYPLTRPVAGKTASIGLEFFDPAKPPAGTSLLFEGLPSLDATVGLDVIAASARD